VPVFPQAVHHVQKENLETAMRANIREKASYLEENWKPLCDRGLVKLHEGSLEILDGLQANLSQGHTRGMQLVSIEGEGRTLSYCADLMPLSTHVNPVVTMGYDIDPLRVIEEKIFFLENIVKDNGWLFFEHDAHVAVAERGTDARGRYCAGKTIAHSMLPEGV
jgi:glyoxylase-like metal-dependent hydrolase (beta-lactamase superfamily II)